MMIMKKAIIQSVFGIFLFLMAFCLAVKLTYINIHSIFWWFIVIAAFFNSILCMGYMIVGFISFKQSHMHLHGGTGVQNCTFYNGAELGGTYSNHGKKDMPIKYP